MGYNTQFQGSLRVSGISSLKAFDYLANEVLQKEHKGKIKHINLEYNWGMGTLSWNNAEKTYDMDKAIELVISEMQKEYPTFNLNGNLLAQGKRINDRYIIQVNNNKVEIISHTKDNTEEKTEEEKTPTREIKQRYFYIVSAISTPTYKLKSSVIYLNTEKDSVLDHIKAIEQKEKITIVSWQEISEIDYHFYHRKGK